MYIPERVLPQGSAEWLEWRKQGVGGSEIYSLACYADIFSDFLGETRLRVIKPRKTPPAWAATPIQLYREHFGIRKRQIPAFQAERGHRLEPIARELAAETLGVPLEQACVYPDNRPACRVSLDGYHPETGHLIEVKAPMNPWESCPEYVIWQTAYQAEVLRQAGYSVTDILILEIGDDANGELSVRNWDIEDTDRHQILGKGLLDLGEMFYNRYLATATPPPYTRQELFLIEQDETLLELAVQWEELKNEEDSLKRRLTELRERILTYANTHCHGQPGIEGYGLSVRFSETSTRTDYRAALEALAPHAELSAFQRVSNTSATIRLSTVNRPVNVRDSSDGMTFSSTSGWTSY
ncbi:YqaJ viral recombinase family protein [Acidithiobacillus sp. M4-SHS-6]|uniref:YqaJ viral recombinase family protein n=1 Tax=Acidithiobacillus sp. M4-SHS-6 TaxID=3383024 RepID=UPI0039BE5FD8